MSTLPALRYQIVKKLQICFIIFTFLFIGKNTYAQKNFEGVITFNIESQEAKGPQKMDYYVKGNKVRMEMQMPGMAAGMSPTMIFDNGTNKMYTLISQMKSYMEIPINAENNNDDQNDKLTDDDRPVKTGKTEKIAGVECEQWIIKNSDGETELWNAKGFGNFLFVQNNTFMKRKDSQPQWLKEITKEGFFPFRIISKDPKGNVEMKMEVTDVQRKNLSSSLFEIPSGYRKMNIPGR